jgi:hypothetical protein
VRFCLTCLEKSLNSGSVLILVNARNRFFINLKLFLTGMSALIMVLTAQAIRDAIMTPSSFFH